MSFQEMKIKGAWVHTPVRHPDNRGHFEEQFKLSQIESELGRTFDVRQMNQSLSSRGVIRGIHYNVEPKGQAKYVTCPSGAIWDVVVDLRKTSSTYGEWDAIELSAKNGYSVLISEGLGHAFLSLMDKTIVQYLVSGEYRAENAAAVNPLDPSIGIQFNEVASKWGISDFNISDRDINSPLLKDS